MAKRSSSSQHPLFNYHGIGLRRQNLHFLCFITVTNEPFPSYFSPALDMGVLPAFGVSSIQ